MTDTINLGLPCIEGSQAQKHVTHNEALHILDTLVQLAVLDRDLTAPPGSPAEGQRWIVKPTGTGGWAGRDNMIAAWQDGAWLFSAPRTGWLAYVVDEGALLAWTGSAWADAITAITSLNNMTLLGVGTLADTTNPFSAKLNNVLLAAKTVAEGGDGDLRWKLSKESASHTLSMLFQDNYSGRAEIGLTGDDNFHFKVSPDGSTWLDALLVDKSTGQVTICQGFAKPPAQFDAMACVDLTVNGDHIVSQENIDTAVTGIGASGGVETYITDQWKIRAKGSLRVSGQRISSISLPGIKYALRTTITTTQSSLGSGDYLQVSQPIEGLRALKLALGTSGAYAIAVGVYVRSSVTGTFAVELCNSARDRSICKLVTIAAANTWTWVPFSGAPGSGQTAFPGDTSGTWLTDTGAGLRIGITLAAGSTLQGAADAWFGTDVMTTSAQTNLAATTSATFDVTALCTFGGVELPASNRVPLLLRPFHAEIEHCKRYWQKSYDSATAPGTATYLGGFDTNYGTAGTATMSQTVRFNPAMRATPSITLYDDAGNSGKVYRGGSNKAGSATNVCPSGFFTVCSDTTSTTEFFSTTSRPAGFKAFRLISETSKMRRSSRRRQEVS
jgi:hypothetical protein